MSGTPALYTLTPWRTGPAATGRAQSIRHGRVARPAVTRGGLIMRVGILSYPMLFQREGGLQVQVRETIAALNRLGQDDAHPLQAELVDPNRQRLQGMGVVLSQ